MVTGDRLYLAAMYAISNFFMQTTPRKDFDAQKSV